MKKLYLMTALSLFAWAGLMATTQVRLGESLQEAIDNTAAGETVQVQAGTFTGNFIMKEGVNVSGGWNEDFTAQSDYATVLDAQNEGRVLNQPAAFTVWTEWSNFTIQNGNLKTKQADQLGAGVALNKKGRIIHCLVQNNTYSYTSGNCMGGGVGNDAVDSADDVIIDDCIIRNNKATHGGGARIRGTIVRSVIEENLTEANACGGVHLHGGRMYNCIVRKNKGVDTGGVRLYGNTKMFNCLVVENVANNTIGGVSCEGSANQLSDIINCTIVNNKQLGENSSARCGMRFSNSKADAVLANNIVWGNMVGDAVGEKQIEGIDKYTTVNTLNNAVYNAQVGTDGIRLGADNTVTDGPRFMNPAEGDFRLSWQSLLYNKGNTDKVATVGLTTDLDGLNRIQGGVVDLGAYEKQTYNLTISEFENGTISLVDKELTAGVLMLPEGYTAELTITPVENYILKSVTLNEVELMAEEGLYILPAMSEDVRLEVVFAEDILSGCDNLSDMEEVVLGIYDMLGRQFNVETADLPSGLYILHTNKGSQKIIVK